MSYDEQLIDLCRLYEIDGHTQPFGLRDVVEWGYAKGLCQIPDSKIVNLLVKDLSRAMRADLHVNPQGQAVRTKHVASYVREGKQLLLWADIKGATREHMGRSFEQREQGVIQDWSKLKIEVDSYNTNENTGIAVQLILHFTNLKQAVKQ